MNWSRLLVVHMHAAVTFKHRNGKAQGWNTCLKKKKKFLIDAANMQCMPACKMAMTWLGFKDRVWLTKISWSQADIYLQQAMDTNEY